MTGREHDIDCFEVTDCWIDHDACVGEVLDFLAQIRESDQRLAELGLCYDSRLKTPAFIDLDVSGLQKGVTAEQRDGILNLAATLNLYYPSGLSDD